MNSEKQDKIFITGGPRSGTTICQSIVVSLGYHNAAIDLDIGNGEDKAFNQVIKSFNDNASIHTKQSYLSEFDAYFSSLLDEEFVHNKPICIKYPMLCAMPVAEPKITMLDRPYYDQFIISTLRNFDKLIFIERHWENSLASEIKRKPWIKKDHHSLEHFSRIYREKHNETYKRISTISSDLGLRKKVNRIFYEDLLNDTKLFISKFKSLLKKNQLITCTDDILISFIKDRPRTAPGVINTLTTLLGHVNHLKTLRVNNKIDFGDFNTSLTSTINKIRSNDQN